MQAEEAGVDAAVAVVEDLRARWRRRQRAHTSRCRCMSADEPHSEHARAGVVAADAAPETLTPVAPHAPGGVDPRW